MNNNNDEFHEFLRGLTGEQAAAYARARLEVLQDYFRPGHTVELPSEEQRHHMAMQSIGLEPYPGETEKGE